MGRLFVVESAFRVETKGVVVVGRLEGTSAELRAGTPVEVRRRDGSVLLTTITNTSATHTGRGVAEVMLRHVTDKSQISPLDEVWSSDAADGQPPGASPAAGLPSTVSPPGTQPRTGATAPPAEPSMRATLLRRSWLRRALRVETPEGPFEVVYNGRGGWHGEAVFLNGQVAARNERLWFGPVLVFPLAGRLAAVEVRAWPWLTIRSFHLLVEDEVLYAEGVRQPFLGPGWADAERETARAAVALSQAIAKQLPWSQQHPPDEAGPNETGRSAGQPGK